MPKYTVRIETSVSVDAETPEEAASIATGWAVESLSNSNAQGKVYAIGDKDCKRPVYTFEP